MRLVPILVLVALLAGIPGSTASMSPSSPAASPVATNGDFAGLVEIGDGRRLWLECRGSGGPVVILEAGAGNDADTWTEASATPGAGRTAVLPGVAAFTRVCAYDRPGTVGEDPGQRGRSDPAPMPRDARAMVADLHALLTAADIPGPFVFAGHSFGGLVARLYASTYPDEVAGMVLVDAAHEDYYDRIREVLTPAQWATFAQAPADGADATIESIDIDASSGQMRDAAAAAPLRPMPLAVVTHGRPWDWPPDYPAAALEAVWPPLQEELAALTPDARLVVAEESGHFIPGDEPDVVIAAIRQVVDAVRDPSTWAPEPAADSRDDASGTPGPLVDGALTPLLDDVLSPPHWFVGTDGQVHLVYELVLTNTIPVPVTVSVVEVRDADSGADLARLTGEPLLAAMSLAVSPDTPSVVLPPASVGVVWLDVPLAGPDDVPSAVAHRLTIAPSPDLPVPESWLSYTGAAVAVDRRPPVALGAPLAGAGWAALGSCCDGPHRRALYPIDGEWRLAQRFAIDFNQLDAENRPGAGDPRLPSSFPTFGQPVLAVADATVVEAVDRYPDLLVGEPREDVTPETAGGNRIVLDLGDGRFAVYAHLQQGSVVVQPGDRVQRGQRIAGVGSSGTSGGPHLHFQVTDRPSVVIGDGLPYTFDAFDLTGRTPPLADVLPYYETLEPIPVETDGAGPRRDELPLGRDVVTFADDDSATPIPPTGDFSGLVDIGGRRMHLQCRGHGGPTVILVSGFGNTGGAWTVLPDGVAEPAVLPGVAAFTRVCAYDRPGTLLDAAPPDDRSRSDPAPQPVSADEMVSDLHALLTEAGIPGPYVLVGHSFGGLVSRLYAATYPDEVIGLVLVDAFSEGVRAGLPPDAWRTWLDTNGVPTPEFLAAHPGAERTDIDAAADAMSRAAAAEPLRPMPLVVLAAGHTGDVSPDQTATLPPGYPEALASALVSNAAFLAALTPDARLVTVAASGHYIQAEHPAVVIEAVRQVIDAVRDPGTWASPTPDS